VSAVRGGSVYSVRRWRDGDCSSSIFCLRRLSPMSWPCLRRRSSSSSVLSRRSAILSASLRIDDRSVIMLLLVSADVVLVVVVAAAVVVLADEKFGIWPVLVSPLLSMPFVFVPMLELPYECMGGIMDERFSRRASADAYSEVLKGLSEYTRSMEAYRLGLYDGKPLKLARVGI
jgi:hypothetical protein